MAERFISAIQPATDRPLLSFLQQSANEDRRFQRMQQPSGYEGALGQVLNLGTNFLQGLQQGKREKFIQKELIKEQNWQNFISSAAMMAGNQDLTPEGRALLEQSVTRLQGQRIVAGAEEGRKAQGTAGAVAGFLADMGKNMLGIIDKGAKMKDVDTAGAWNDILGSLVDTERPGSLKPQFSQSWHAAQASDQLKKLTGQILEEKGIVDSSELATRGKPIFDYVQRNAPAYSENFYATAFGGVQRPLSPQDRIIAEATGQIKPTAPPPVSTGAATVPTAQPAPVTPAPAATAPPPVAPAEPQPLTPAEVIKEQAIYGPRGGAFNVWKKGNLNTSMRAQFSPSTGKLVYPYTNTPIPDADSWVTDQPSPKQLLELSGKKRDGTPDPRKSIWAVTDATGRVTDIAGRSLDMNQWVRRVQPSEDHTGIQLDRAGRTSLAVLERQFISQATQLRSQLATQKAMIERDSNLQGKENAAEKARRMAAAEAEYNTNVSQLRTNVTGGLDSILTTNPNLKEVVDSVRTRLEAAEAKEGRGRVKVDF